MMRVVLKYSIRLMFAWNLFRAEIKVFCTSKLVHVNFSSNTLLDPSKEKLHKVDMARVCLHKFGKEFKCTFDFLFHSLATCDVTQSASKCTDPLILYGHTQTQANHLLRIAGQYAVPNFALTEKAIAKVAHAVYIHHVIRMPPLPWIQKSWRLKLAKVLTVGTTLTIYQGVMESIRLVRDRISLPVGACILYVMYAFQCIPI